MIRITQLRDVVDLEQGGGVRSVMVVTNDAGLSAEVPVTAQQVATIVRLVQADEQPAAPAPEPEPERPRLAPHQLPQTVLPPREVDASVFVPPDPDATPIPQQMDVQSLLDMSQPASGEAIPGEADQEWGGAGQF
jgi:hypothetical protein